MNMPSRVLFAEISGPACWLCGSIRRLITMIAVMAVVFFAAAGPVLAINAPTITQVAGVAVAPETTMYSNQAAFQIRGNAEAGTTVTLYRGTTLLTTTITPGTGFWVIDLTGQPQGSFNFTATAYDGLFTSEPSVAVPVIIDWTPPSLNTRYGNSGCRSDAKYQCQIGLIYATVTDALSKPDFSTVNYKVDYAPMPTTGDPDTVTVSTWYPVAGTISNDGTSQINFYPDATGWNNIRQPFRQIRLWATIADKAGNVAAQTKTFYLHTIRPDPPTVLKIWDPGHNVFTGSGETAANVPDGSGFVNYFSGMTVVNNPIKIKGKLNVWNEENKGWYACHIGEEVYTRRALNIINQANGEFLLEYPGLVFPQGPITLDVRGRDSGDCLGRNPTNLSIVTQFGTPYPRVSCSPGGEPAIIGSRLWPTFTGKVKKMPAKQTVQIGWGDYSYTSWLPQLSQEILPQGQAKLNNAGVYDAGDVFYDANDDGLYTAGEEFFDMPAATSDGESFTLVNFRNLEYNRNTLSYLGILTRNTYGKSAAERVVRAHNNESYLPLLQDLSLSPAHTSSYRNAALKPSSMTLKVQTWGGNYDGAWSWSGHYYLDYPNSYVTMTNGQGTNIPLPAPSWADLTKLAFQGTVDLSSVALPEGTYTIKARLQDNLTLVTEDSSNWFKIDNTAPTATEQVPANNEDSNSYTSFSAKIVDPVLADGSAGSGANIDVAKPQLWPYKRLADDKTCTSTSSRMVFTLTGGDVVPYDYKGTALGTGAGSPVEIWVNNSGAFAPTPISGYIRTIYNNGTVQIQNNAGNFQSGKTYAIMLPVPFFTSNNGVDKVGAVPISMISADGTYITKVVTRDRADNTGTFYATTSNLEIAFGPISFTLNQPFLFAGLVPNDVATFTTSSVTTRKGNYVKDGQPLSLVQTPNTLTLLVPPDANGIPGDGHQVKFGQNGASTGVGQACFGVNVLTKTAGSFSVFGVIGLASGTSSVIPISLIDTFTAAPVADNIQITVANPNPLAEIATGFLGKSPRNVPDGSLATCTTNFGTLVTDDAPAVAGNQASSVNGSATVRLTSNTKGTATVTITMGGRTTNAAVTFIDKYPPPAPLGLALTPQYSNTGSSVLTWSPSIDIGGAGTSMYTIERSTWSGSAWSAYAALGTSATNSYLISGLTDGQYRFRVKAHDADGNIGAYSIASPNLIVDTVAPPAVACSDIGAGNNDPDELFSYDPNIYFYYSATDDRSGVGEVQVQVSISPDTTGLVQEPWVPAGAYYLFQDGQGFRTYYARVRVKDRAGNIGGWGTWSNGISVIMSGATSPPNAPTLTKISGKNAVPGVPVPLNITSGILVEGLSEASNLIMVYVDGAYKGSVISTGAGAFSTSISLTAGLHAVKVKAHNGFAESAFSNEISIVIDTTKPVMTRKTYDIHSYERLERYVGTTASDHPIATIDFLLSDAGGSGFDINSAQASLVDIDDAGNPIPAVAPYINPVSTTLSIISADRVRIVAPAAWKDCLQDQHRYRLTWSLKDFAGNSNSWTFDFVIDNLRPGQAPEVPTGTTPANCNVKNLYVYDLEAYPWSTMPPASALVPYTWDTTANAYQIDPAFNNAALVDKTTTPASLLFNTVAFYGLLYAAEQPQPAAKKGYDARSASFNLAWGYGSGITMGPDGLGNYKSFMFPFRTMTNGLNAFTLVDQDHAICRNNYTIKFYINSPNPAPRPPISASFANAANPAVVYPVWTDWAALFPGGASPVNHRDTIITDNPNALIVTVKIPVELFEQTVQIYSGSTILSSAVVSPGNNTAVMTIDQAAASGIIDFQIRTYANTYYSTNLPRELSYYYFRWVKNDFTPPQTFDVYPIETFYNALTGADARPFPTQFSVKGKDTANGSVQSYIHIANSTISMVNAGGTALAGTLYRDYDVTNDLYGYRYYLTAAPTTEGTYYYRLYLPDGARPNFNSQTYNYPFKLDKTAPIPVVINPSDGAVTNSLPSFNAQVADPNLADGTTGSGPNMDPSRAQIFPFKNLGTAAAVATNVLTATVYGIDQIATDHVDKPIPVGTAVKFAKALAGGKYEFPTITGSVTANGTDKITASVTSGSLTVGTTYAIIYEIPNFPSNDGISRIAAVPIQPAIKGGAYLVFLKLIDNSLNQGAYSSSSSIYEAAYGTFTLTPSRNTLYVGLYPPHTSNYVSSPILTTEGNPIMSGTEVTVLTNRGSFSPADSNGIPGDGHQVKANAAGQLLFGLQATGLNLGLANVRAVLGLASGTDTSVNLIQIPQFSVSCSAEELIISPSTPNPSTTFTTSPIGNAGDLVPNGTAVNVFTDLGSLSPADVYPTVAGYQANSTSGVSTFALSSPNAGLASVTLEVGGRYVYKMINFVDRYPPNAPGTPSPDNVLNNNGVFNLIWVAPTDPANSGIAAYGIEYSLNGGAYVHLASSTTSGYLTSGLPQGKYTFRVRAVDGAGNVGAYSGASAQVEVDTTPPLGSIVVAGGAVRTNNPAVTLTLSASDAKGVADMSFSNDGISWSGWVPYGTSMAWTLSAGDENKIVYVRYRDTVGNIGIYTDDILFDATGPTGAINIAPAPYSKQTALDLTFTVLDASPVSTMALSYDGGAYTSQAFNAYIVWNVPTTFATHTASVRFYDVLGNVSGVYSATTCIDTSLPTTPAVTDDGDYSPYLDKLHASWTGGTDAQSGTSHFLVRVGKTAGAADVVAETNVGLVNEITFGPMPLDITGATMYYFTVYAVDRAGNLSAAGGSNGIKGGDPTPPAAVLVSDAGAFTASNNTLVATWTASSDPDSGIARYEVSIGTTSGGTNILNWTNVGLAQTYTATGLSLVHNTKYFINVRIYNGGGTYTISSSDGITVDTAVPPVPAMGAEPAYSSGTANIVNCSSVVDPVSGGVTYYFECSTSSTFATISANSGWITAPTHTFTGLTDGTTYYFRVRARDAVLNTCANSAAVNSIQDAFPPTATAYTDSVALNNDPDQQWSRDATISFAATGLADPGAVKSGVSDVFVEISNSSSFATLLWSGLTGNTTGAKTFTVASPVDGNKIYARAQYIDVAGNRSSAWQNTDGITLDLVDPSAGATTDLVAGNNDPDHNVSSNSWIYFGFSHNDAVSQVADVLIQVATDAGFTQIATSTLLGSAVTSYLYKFGEDGKTYYARIKVKDFSGRCSDLTLNFSSAANFGTPSDGIRVDLTPPSPLDASFYINKKAGVYLGESTTATSVVYLTFTVSDPSGIAKAQISNNGTVWTTINNPLLTPASYPWTLDLVPGFKTVSVIFTDGLGHASPLAQQTIEFRPSYKVFIGTRDDRSYPTDTYEEYYGQNKYGSPRKDASAPNKGSSLRLVKP